MNANCRICGLTGIGTAFDDWVKPTFTDWDKLQPGKIICNNCLFWFDESSEALTKLVDKWWPTFDGFLAANLDRVESWQKRNRTRNMPTPHDLKMELTWGGWCIPQRMRNYSHFIVRGEWIPLSKGDKARMKELLLGEPFPELAAIAESGQKHIVFRATRNPPGAKAGWMQFEEQSLFVEPDDLAGLLEVTEELYATFSKAEIESGDYSSHRILKFGFDRWMELEARLKGLRGGLLFALAIFLAQKGENNEARRMERTAQLELGIA